MILLVQNVQNKEMITTKAHTILRTFLIAALFLTACQKDKEATPDLLIGTWQMEGWSGNCPIGSVTQSPASYKDNIITFHADSTFLIDYGTQRGEGEPKSGNNSGQWSSEKKGGARTIYIKSGTFNLYWDIQSFVIKELDANKLVFEWSRKGAHPKGPTVYSFKKK